MITNHKLRSLVFATLHYLLTMAIDIKKVWFVWNSEGPMGIETVKQKSKTLIMNVDQSLFS